MNEARYISPLRLPATLKQNQLERLSLIVIAAFMLYVGIDYLADNFSFGEQEYAIACAVAAISLWLVWLYAPFHKIRTVHIDSSNVVIEEKNKETIYQPINDYMICIGSQPKRYSSEYIYTVTLIPVSAIQAPGDYLLRQRMRPTRSFLSSIITVMHRHYAWEPDKKERRVFATVPMKGKIFLFGTGKDIKLLKFAVEDLQKQFFQPLEIIFQSEEVLQDYETGVYMAAKNNTIQGE